MAHVNDYATWIAYLL